jgi:hypothetical protein
MISNISSVRRSASMSWSATWWLSARKTRCEPRVLRIPNPAHTARLRLFEANLCLVRPLSIYLSFNPFITQWIQVFKLGMCCEFRSIYRRQRSLNVKRRSKTKTPWIFALITTGILVFIWSSIFIAWVAKRFNQPAGTHDVKWEKQKATPTLEYIIPPDPAFTDAGLDAIDANMARALFSKKEAGRLHALYESDGVVLRCAFWISCRASATTVVDLPFKQLPLQFTQLLGHPPHYLPSLSAQTRLY